MPINVQEVPYTNFYGAVVVCSSAPVITVDANGKIFRYDGSGNVNVTVPATLPVGFNVGFVMFGTGTITLVAGTGATNRSAKVALGRSIMSGSPCW